MQEQALENKKIICVDLDGTLVLTDTLIESVILALKKNPLIILILPLWILRGKLYFKNRIGSIVIPNCESLPYNYELIDYLKTEKQNNSIIVLVTASIQSIADAVARHLMLFDFVYGSSDSVNLRAENKKNKLTEKFGFKKYIYAGDSKADIPVWFGASSAILVNPSKSIIKELKKQVLVQKTIYTPGKSIKSFIKEIRIYQWIKNILIFLPLLLAHQITNQPLLFTAFIAFLSYSFAASSIYILNDLLDLESDRNHPRKKNRPFSSGVIPVTYGFFLFPVLLAISIGLSVWFLNYKFLFVLIGYILLTTSYSFAFKRIAVLDIIVLAFLYTLRLIAGANAVDVIISPWLMGFSIFLFLSLALIKRYQELLVMIQKNRTETKGRGYRIEDLQLISSMGSASAIISVLVLALYLNSKEVISLYKHPEVLWMAVVCYLYWIMRMWMIAHRGKMEDDPIVYTAKDYVSYIIGLIIIILAIGASL